MRKHGIHFYIIGIVILTLGIALAVQSSLGTSPFDSLLVGLFRTFGLTIGSWEIIVSSALILINGLALRKRPEFFSAITALITGIGIDSWLFLIGDIIVPTMWLEQAICLLFSIFFTGLGIAINLQSIVAPNPMDRSMIIVTKLTGWNMTISRVAIGVVLVSIAFFFQGDIGIGTLANAIFVGMVIQMLLPTAEKMREASLRKAGMRQTE